MVFKDTLNHRCTFAFLGVEINGGAQGYQIGACPLCQVYRAVNFFLKIHYSSK